MKARALGRTNSNPFLEETANISFHTRFLLAGRGSMVPKIKVDPTINITFFQVSKDLREKRHNHLHLLVICQMKVTAYPKSKIN